jgi:hypothetical protein
MTKRKPKTSLPATLSAAELCWVLDLTISAVTLLEREGILAKSARDVYLLESIPAYIRSLRRRGEGPASWQKARTELAQERALAAKMVRLERQGELLARDVVELILANNNRTIRDALLGLGAKLAPMLRGTTSAAAIQALVDERVREILSGIAEQEEGAIMRRIEAEAARRAKRAPVAINGGDDDRLDA